MAYTLFPTKTADILKIKPDPIRGGEIVELFGYLKRKYKTVKTPINIDPGKLSIVNVTRELQGTADLNVVKKEAKLDKIKIKFGAGSAGNRGVANRGNLFENTFARAVESYWSGQEVQDSMMLKAIEDLAKTYNFKRLKNLNVKEEGALNTKRPLQFRPGPYISSPTGSLDIGPTVTDLTLHKGKNINNYTRSEVVSYLSLKLGGTTTFFNIGVKKILTKSEIQTGKVKDRDGIKLLDMFGIDNKTFCQIFNGTLKKGFSSNTFNKINKRYLETFLQSGLGYGFHVIHKLTSEIKSFKVDKNYMLQATRPRTCQVFYGGLGGQGKRVDIVIMTPKYKMKVNIRDTQGTDGYPTRIMGDFNYL
tara:strand:- start:670 stop:1755 length:1086 start_codon:yes stop_codon:yes gene_type:complete